MITRFWANCFIILQGKYEQNEEIFIFYFRHSIDIQCDVNIYCFFFFNDNGIENTPEAETYFRPYDYWPNPAANQLHLRYSPDAQPALIEFYDLQGHCMYLVQSDFESVDLQNLTAGQYLMKVTMRNGKTYTNKVVYALVMMTGRACL